MCEENEFQKGQLHLVSW